MALQANKTGILCFLICFLLISNTYAQSYKVYKDPVKHFKVSIPETWTYIPNYKDAWFLAHRPVSYKGESKIENVVLSKMKDSSAAGLDAFYLSSILSNRYRDSTMSIVEEGKSKKGDYYWYADTHKNIKTNEIIKSMTVIFYVKPYIFVLQCTSSPASYNTYKDIFLKIADSFELK